VAIALNPAQKQVVEHDIGPMLVLAGAGSGKTRVVTERIARLLERGVSPQNILAMTFTNKAAAEMHERVVRLVGAKAGKDLRVCTFHRFGLETLSAEVRALGLRGSSFAIFDQADATSAIREILREIRAGKNFDIGAILARISAAKNDFMEPEEWLEKQRKSRGVDDYDEISMLVYPKYLAALRAMQAYDFDDLICELVKLWKRRPDVLEKYRMRYRYLMIDEYQDTNHAQLELVLLLGGKHRNVVVVGDDDQSIYSWRGADVRNILEFEEHFPGAKVAKLEYNYRSRAPILTLANAVLAKTTGKRHKKTLMATRGEGPTVVVVAAADPDVEASFVASQAQELIERNGVRPKDIAVLYRSNLQAQPIESALKERTIPLRMLGGQQFFERKEVKDLIAYLKCVLVPDDEMSLRRIINYPARGIGEAAFTKLLNHATAHDLSLWAVVQRAHAVRDLPPAALDGCRKLVRIIEGGRLAFEQRDPSAVVAQKICDAVGLKEDIMVGSANPQVAARRWGNVEGLFKVFARRDEQGKGNREQFAEFLRLLALRTDEDEAEAQDKVTLTTMHGAKGLEFPYVFVIGVEEGFCPHSRTTNERATDFIPGDGDAAVSLEEERRLFYVAVTRAKERLVLLRCKNRGQRGKILPRTPSRFLLELPKELYEEREENAAVAPGLEKTRAGAAGILAMLSQVPPAELPMIPRRQRY
jgi:ATP-dependent DNA helicase Rep